MALTKAQKEQRKKEISEFTLLLKTKFKELAAAEYKTPEDFEQQAAAAEYNALLNRAYAQAALDVYHGLGYNRPFKEKAIYGSGHLFKAESLPAEYDGSGIIAKQNKQPFHGFCVRVRGGRNMPFNKSPIDITYQFLQFTQKQKDALLNKIAADGSLFMRCQKGFLDIRLFDLFAVLNLKLLPTGPEDFESVLFQDSAWDDTEMYEDKALALSITPVVLLYLCNPESFSVDSYLGELGLNLRGLLKKMLQQQKTDYKSLDTIRQLLERPLSAGIPDRGATLPELAATDTLPLSDAGIFSVCGDISVPEGKYPLRHEETYEEFCQNERGALIERLTEIYEKARRLAKRRLHASDTELPEIEEEETQLVLNLSGIVYFNHGFSGRIKMKYESFCSSEDPTRYDHSVDMDYSDFYVNCGNLISGIPEIYFFDANSVDEATDSDSSPLLALCCLWQIATKLVIAGDFAPQLYYVEAGDSYSVRWIPDVRIEAVKDLCAQVGYAADRLYEEEDWNLLAVTANFKEYPPMDPAQLGVTLLSKFIQSYVFAAALGKNRRYLPDSPSEHFPFTQCYFGHDNRSWYFDALFDCLKPFSEITKGLKSVLLLEAGTPEERALRLAEQALEALPAPKAKGRKTKALKEAEENLSRARAAYGLSLFRQNAESDAQNISDEEDPLFTVTLAFRDLDSEEDRDLGEDEIPPVITYEEVMNDDRYLGFRLQAALKQQDLDKALPGMLSNDRPRASMRLSELSDKIITAADDIRARGFDIIMPRELKHLIKPVTTLSLGIRGQWNESSGFLGLESLLDFDWQIALGNRKISKKDFESLLKKAGRVVRFAGQYVYISKQDAVKFQNRLKARPSRTSGARLIGVAMCGRYGSENVFISQKLKDSIAALLKDQDLEVPREIKAELRPYQIRGFRWLARNLLISMGSILADDMGLGKTLQLITALQYLKNKGELSKEKALVVVPTAVIINWAREIAKFAPDLSCNLFYGLNTDLNLIASHDVTVTTYGTLRTHEKELSEIKFRVIVLDEAQAIKNTTSQVFKAATALKARAMVAMTGTPVENRLLEYWAIMDFVNPGLLGSQATFKREIANPIEKDRNQEKLDLFRAITAPFILRRLKTDKNVIADLPDKTVTDQFCELTPVQAALYESVVEEGLETVSRAADKFNRGNKVLNMILKLRQICNAPEHFSKESPHKGAEFSGKAEALFEILDQLGESGRKCLVFTQYKEMGDILVEWIRKKTGRKPQFIHGGVPVKKRTEIVDSFQTDPAERVLVLTLKAAGTGLNLTAATAVIHYDLWWNPAVEEQATDRTYRIGQRKDVQVFRLICANTFEEKINELIASKRELSDLTVVTGEQWIGNLDDSELSQIFRLTK